MTQTLYDAIETKYRDDWSRMRSGACLYSQAYTAAGQAALHILGPQGATSNPGLAQTISAAQVTPAIVKALTAYWYSKGLSPATITKRLNCLSAIGVNVEGCRPKAAKGLKWWLRPEDREKLCVQLRASPAHPLRQTDAHILADFIDWTCLTGLRVEESLRLGKFDAGRRWDPKLQAYYWWVCVPGTKTATAQATLPLGEEAASIIERLRDEPGPGVFKITYDRLHAAWQDARAILGVEDVPTATLKALRRSAARYLHIDRGMPLHMVQQYLRHEDMKTTLSYLRLTGGYGTEEMRKWL